MKRVLKILAVAAMIVFPVTVFGDWYLDVYNGNEKYQVGAYKDGKKEGIWNENTFIGVYKDGKREGLWKYMNETDVNIEANYKNGVLHGEYSSTNHDIEGSLSGTYKDGKKEGKWESNNYETGEKSVEYYKNGLLHGEYKKDYGDSNEEGNYKEGKKEGRWMYSDPTGQSVEYYKDGKLVKK